MKYAIVLKHPEAGDVYWHAKALTWVEAHQFPTQFNCVHDAHEEWAANIWPELRHDLENKVGYIEHPCWRELERLITALDELTEIELKQLVEPELVEQAARHLLMEAPRGKGARYTNLQALNALRAVDRNWTDHFPTLDGAIDFLTAIMDRAHSIWEAEE